VVSGAKRAPNRGALKEIAVTEVADAEGMSQHHDRPEADSGAVLW